MSSWKLWLREWASQALASWIASSLWFAAMATPVVVR